jgi:hypothetical protein
VAIYAALAAVVLVIALGAAVRGPLSRVPENTLKFIVGVMLASFGAFWGAEGAGAIWPGADAALLVIAPAVGAYCLLLAWVLRRTRRAAAKRPELVTANGHPSPEPAAAAEPSAAEPSDAASASLAAPLAASAPAPRKKPGRLAAFGLFWYDFIVGDDWRVTAGVVILLVAIALAQPWAAAWIIAPLGLALLIPYGTWRAARR